jgi:hypothetical protein
MQQAGLAAVTQPNEHLPVELRSPSVAGRMDREVTSATDYHRCRVVPKTRLTPTIAIFPSAPWGVTALAYLSSTFDPH